MKNCRRSPSLVKPVQYLWVCMTSKGSREQNETKCFHQLSEIPQSWESSALFLDLILKLQVTLASFKEVGGLTLGYGLCLQGKVEETQGGPLWICPDPPQGRVAFASARLLAGRSRFWNLLTTPTPSSLYVPVVSRPVVLKMWSLDETIFFWRQIFH